MDRVFGDDDIFFLVWDIFLLIFYAGFCSGSENCIFFVMDCGFLKEMKHFLFFVIDSFCEEVRLRDYAER